jgi:hypothetical protein
MICLFEIEEHKDFYNQNPVVMIARIFQYAHCASQNDRGQEVYCLFARRKKLHLITNIYDMNKFCTCKFEL